MTAALTGELRRFNEVVASAYHSLARRKWLHPFLRHFKGAWTRSWIISLRRTASYSEPETNQQILRRSRWFSGVQSFFHYEIRTGSPALLGRRLILKGKCGLLLSKTILVFYLACNIEFLFSRAFTILPVIRAYELHQNTSSRQLREIRRCSPDKHLPSESSLFLNVRWRVSKHRTTEK